MKLESLVNRLISTVPPLAANTLPTIVVLSLPDTVTLVLEPTTEMAECHWFPRASMFNFLLKIIVLDEVSDEVSLVASESVVAITPILDSQLPGIAIETSPLKVVFVLLRALECIWEIPIPIPCSCSYSDSDSDFISMLEPASDNSVVPFPKLAFFFSICIPYPAPVAFEWIVFLPFQLIELSVFSLESP